MPERSSPEGNRRELLEIRLRISRNLELKRVIAEEQIIVSGKRN